MHKTLLYFHTLRYLKFKQLWFQCLHLLRRKPVKLKSYPLNNKVPRCLNFRSFLPARSVYHDGRFTFLNKSKHFGEMIDWQFSEYGKLWRYNLNYFDYLNQEGIQVDKGLSLINQFIDNIQDNKVGIEPYPTSLRIINWIKLITQYKIQDTKIDRSLYAQANLLSNNIEYHLLGNHLLENAFSLLFASYYFENPAFYKRAKKILMDELQEQILPDGAHFELSPMYHQIILNRALDCVNLTQNNSLFGEELSDLLAEKAAVMLGWLRQMTFKNGDIPLVNDAANGIAPTTTKLVAYAAGLGIGEKKLPLKDSGYRKIERNNYEMVIDAGNIGPDYIPGHAHSDTFNFVLHIDNSPYIVDTGTSTYEANAIREYERSTKAHNTVQIEDFDQSEVWRSFRVGRRAFITEKEEGENFIEATHDGYKNIGAFHTRKFRFYDEKVHIIDTVKSQKDFKCYAYFHFHPDIAVTVDGNIIFTGSSKILLKNQDSVSLEEYHFAPEFNKRIESKVLVVTFRYALETEIVL